MIQGFLRVATALLLCATLLSSTAGFYHFYAWMHSSKRLSHYIDYLEDEAMLRGHSVNFNTMAFSIVDEIPIGSGSVIGICILHPVTMQRTILILERFWKSASDSARKALLLHEIGHCYYLLDHDDTIDNIMTSSMHNRTTLSKEKLDEFFKRAYPYRTLR